MEHLDPSKIRTLLESRDGKQLLELLQKSSAETLRQASEAAKTGDYDRVQTLLKPVVDGSGGEVLARTLAQRLG